MNIVFLYSNKFDKRKTFSWVNKESKVAAVVSSNVPLKLLDSSPSEQLLPSFLLSAVRFVFLIAKTALNMGDCFGIPDSQSLWRTNMTNIDIRHIIFFKYGIFILSENEELARMAASPKLS